MGSKAHAENQRGNSVKQKSPALALLISLAVGATSMPAFAQESVGQPGRNSRGPNPLGNVYFGEQHLHTENSPDPALVDLRLGTQRPAIAAEHADDDTGTRLLVADLVHAGRVIGPAPV